MRRVVAALVGAAFLVTGCGSTVSGVAAPQSTPAPAPAEVQVADPVGIQIDKIGVRRSLVPTGRDGDGWEVPDEADQPSWYQPGPEPGEPGAAVVLGHINLQHRPGVFARLGELVPGDRIQVLQAQGQLEFEVAEVRQQPKDQFNPASLLDTGPYPELVLITCGGELERTAQGGSYRDNTIVIARPVG
jgi:hypothetical protein